MYPLSKRELRRLRDSANVTMSILYHTSNIRKLCHLGERHLGQPYWLASPTSCQYRKQSWDISYINQMWCLAENSTLESTYQMNNIILSVTLEPLSKNCFAVSQEAHMISTFIFHQSVEVHYWILASPNGTEPPPPTYFQRQSSRRPIKSV